MLKLLDVGGNDVCMVGIWGMGGIGKTTIAKAVYNSIASKFEGCCFLGNVRANSKPHRGLVRLQNNLLYEILGDRKVKMTDADRGIQVIKERLGSKRVLLVLDDVDKLNQLDKLAGELDWFGSGSRIIITTRDKRLLIAHQVYPIYTAKALDNDEACQLLILNAFKKNRNLDECVKFPIVTAVHYAAGLPLAINILGSLLCGKSQWHATLDGCRRFPNSNIQKVLQTSYDELEYPLKEAFLDIACFLKGKNKNYVMQALEALEGSHLNPIDAIEVLEEKALINTDRSGKIWMHDLLEEMGKEIVHKQSPEDAGRRSRLWSHEDVYRVLTENTGSNKVKGIIVELPKEGEICLSAKCFKKMNNLQLFININARFSGEVNYLPNQLRFLDWPGFPAQSLPSDFNPQELVKLNMPESRISRLGQGPENLQNLKYVSFASCKFLTEVPDLSGMFPNLERLNLNDCTSLAQLHPSVGFLDKLVEFNIRNCDNLEMFPRIVNMKSLKFFDLSDCKRLKNFPEIVRRMESLTRMDVSRTAIKEVPSSIGYDLCNLVNLSIYSCKNLTNLPPSIYGLPKLRNLGLKYCPKLVLPPFPKKVEYCEMPTPTSSSKISQYGKATSSETESNYDGGGGDDDDQGNLALFPSLRFFYPGRCYTSDCDFLVRLGCASTLTTLDFSESNFVSLPACLTKFINLEELSLRGCNRLQEVLELPPKLRVLDVSDCLSLERISKLSNIWKYRESQMFEWLDLTNCRRLRDNLVQEAETKGLLVNYDHQVEADLFSLFLSSQKSEFGVVFPASLEIPKWFSCQMDFKGNGQFEFDIQVLPNFKWENTGLALCVAAERTLCLGFQIFINEVLLPIESLHNHILLRGFNWGDDSAHVWLFYIPFDTIDMSPFGYQRPLAPFQCRVSIYQRLYPDEAPLKSCGVHLVMPPNEECMKLSHAWNLRDSHKTGLFLFVVETLFLVLFLSIMVFCRLGLELTAGYCRIDYAVFLCYCCWLITFPRFQNRGRLSFFLDSN
ncbi:hypothetical protein ABKV19_014755 [Rosa sericea]